MTMDTLKLYELIFTQINQLGWTLLIAYIARLAQQYFMHRLDITGHGVFELLDATEPGTSAGPTAIGFPRAPQEPAADEA